MKIILLIFAAIQVTTLQGLPMTCTNKIVNRFMVMMPSPFKKDKWIFFSWPVRKTIIMNGVTAGNAEDMVVKNEYDEKEENWSKMDSKWMEEIKNFIADKYKLSNKIKESSKIFESKNSEKSEYLSKEEGDWIQLIKEYFKNKYLSGSKTSKSSEKSKQERDDFWSKMNGKWAQEIRDYKKNKFSSEASVQFPEKNKDTNITTTKPSAEIEEIKNESSLELNVSSFSKEKEKIKDLELDSSEKYVKGQIGKKPNSNLNLMTSEEFEILPPKMPSLEKEVPKNKEEKENSSSEEDLSAEIKEKLEKLGKKEKFQSESSKIVGTVGNTNKPFIPSSNEDGTFNFDISKSVNESEEKIYKPEKSKSKIKGKVFVFPQKDIITEKTFKNNKTENLELGEKLRESYENQENEKNDKLSVISDDEVEKELNDMPVMACQKATTNNDANGKTHSSEESGEKSKESFEKEEEVKKDNLSASSSEDEEEKILENSKSTGDFNNNFQGFGKLKVKFKKHKIPYGLAKKLQEGYDIDRSGKWSKKTLKRFTSV